MTIGRVVQSLTIATLAMGAVARQFTPEILVQTNRFSGNIAVSPNNSLIAFIQTRYSMEDKRQNTELLIQGLPSDSSGQSSTTESQLVTAFSVDARPNPPASEENVAAKKQHKPSQPVWLSDSTLGYVVADSASGKSTLYAVSSGKHRHWSKPYPVMTTVAPIADLQYNAASGILAFTAAVYNGTTLEETFKRDRKEQERADTGETYDDLWVRHWDTFVSPKVSQIHTLKLGGTGHFGQFKPKSEVRNIIRDTPVDGRLDVTDSFVFSPDGQQVAFVAKKPAGDYAWKTTSYVYVADVGGSAAAPINEGDGGASSSPAFSADGSRIVYLQMDAPSYEADRNRIKIYSSVDKSTVSVAETWDRSPSHVDWVDDATLLVTYNEWGRNKLAKIDIVTGTVTPIVSKHSVGSVTRLTGTNSVLIDYSAFDMPTDLYTVSLDSYDDQVEPKRVTDLNPMITSDLLSAAEDLEFVGADNATIHGFILHPPNFDPAKSYPLAFVIHGGPQSSFLDAWSTRWNLNVFASAGFVTVALDPQGSTGYGQKFTDAIRNQWGGKPYHSLMQSLDQLLEARPYIDSTRMAALGASYGGYMINWINGHTDRFRCLVNHDGMFSTISTYYSTEELYFPETEFEGTPFDEQARANYDRWSPERHVANWKTPTLVVHSEKDYRLVVAEGLSTFTALRRQGVPARMLYFPDENHWVLKPANSLRWHHEVIGWITKWTEDSNDKKEIEDSDKDIDDYVVIERHDGARNRLVIQNDEL
ncbi:dipeptidylpeptidase [Coemansia sp. IMI 203386]|nr:dipeptidylpeptidase [Coemansia sp. IMI 203386]